MKTFNPIQARGFEFLQWKLDNQFSTQGHEVSPNRWQGSDISGRPWAKMIELINVALMVDLTDYRSRDWVSDLAPNMPWAENHFQERVCGYPINPGAEWANWPWGDNAEKFLGTDGKFNHNYMERYWPKQAGRVRGPTRDAKEYRHAINYSGYPLPHSGIRGSYGDLNDVVDLLVKEPDTRQAYLPMWFPEDTGIGDGGRKPCTLGYLFFVRDGGMHIQYMIRSCDYFRHMADDIYLTIRLGEWIIEQAASQDEWWKRVEIKSFTMLIGSLHVFINDLRTIKERLDAK